MKKVSLYGVSSENVHKEKATVDPSEIPQFWSVSPPWCPPLKIISTSQKNGVSAAYYTRKEICVDLVWRFCITCNEGHVLGFHLCLPAWVSGWLWCQFLSPSLTRSPPKKSKKNVQNKYFNFITLHTIKPNKKDPWSNSQHPEPWTPLR